MSSLLALLMGGPAVTAASKTITVDCSKGQSINQALGDKSEELVVEIEGLCHEKVVVRRSCVTLRGSDPEEAQFAVEIHDLGLRDNDGAGLAVWGSLVQLTNVAITDNGGVGVHASGASGVRLIDSVVSNNAEAGINATCGGSETKSSSSCALCP